MLRGYWVGGEAQTQQHSEVVREEAPGKEPKKEWVVGRYKEGVHWQELREEGSGKQTGPEGKARIGVTSAETKLGYSRKQTGEPRPELQAVQGPQRAKRALFWAVGDPLSCPGKSAPSR